MAFSLEHSAISSSLAICSCLIFSMSSSLCLILAFCSSILRTLSSIFSSLLSSLSSIACICLSFFSSICSHFFSLCSLISSACCLAFLMISSSSSCAWDMRFLNHRYPKTHQSANAPSTRAIVVRVIMWLAIC